MTLLWIIWICCCMTRCSWDLFIFSMVGRAFSCTCNFSAWYFTSWSYDSNLCNSGFSDRFSCICALLLLNFLHYSMSALILSTVLRAFTSRWSCSSDGVLGIAWSCSSTTLCCSCWMTSGSFITWRSMGSSTFCSKPVTERNALLTASSIPICFVTSCSFSFWIFVRSLSNFSCMASFSCCATWRCYMISLCECFRA